MTSTVLARFKQKIAEFVLVPATGGCFEVSIDSELVHSKLRSGTFPPEDVIIDAITARLKR